MKTLVTFNIGALEQQSQRLHASCFQLHKIQELGKLNWYLRICTYIVNLERKGSNYHKSQGFGYF